MKTSISKLMNRRKSRYFESTWNFWLTNELLKKASNDWSIDVSIDVSIDFIICCCWMREMKFIESRMKWDAIQKIKLDYWWDLKTDEFRYKYSIMKVTNESNSWDYQFYLYAVEISSFHLVDSLFFVDFFFSSISISLIVRIFIKQLFIKFRVLVRHSTSSKLCW